MVEVCLMRIAGTTADRWLTRPGARKRKCRLTWVDFPWATDDWSLHSWQLQGVTGSPNAVLPGCWP
jgi:hypothetical protein